jgi:hypothetical protein
LRLTDAVHNSIVAIPLKRNVWIGALHPLVKPMVEEKICQQGTYHTTLGSAFVPIHKCSILPLGWGFKPSPNVQENPLAVRVLSDSPHDKAVIQIIKEPLDIQIHHPVIPPTSLSRTTYRLES